MLKRFAGFDWDEGNRDKCRKHGVSTEEIEQALRGRAEVILPDVRHSDAEDRFIAAGRTDAGRPLLVAFTYRVHGDAVCWCAPSAPVTCTRRRRDDMGKRIPRLRSDEAAEAMLEQDLTDYLDPDHMAPLTFEHRAKDKTVSLRLPEALLQAIKLRAGREGIPYQRYMRRLLEQAMRP